MVQGGGQGANKDNTERELDLSYITPRLIAMGAPYDEPPMGTGLGKNAAARVAAFLAERHGSHFRVYDLTLERAYSANTFTEAVARAAGADAVAGAPVVVRRGFADHHAAPLGLLFALLDELARYHAADERNVAVVHCMAGRGRTGLVACAYLLYTGVASSAQEAMLHFAHARGQPLRTPSQRRYVGYVAEALCRSPVPRPCPIRVPEPPVVLAAVEVHAPPPHMRLAVHVAQLLPPHKPLVARAFDVVQGRAAVGHVLCGDVMLCGSEVVRGSPLVFRASFHTMFVQAPGRLVLSRAEIDGGITGGFYDARFGPDFSLVLVFEDTSAFFRARL